MDLSQAAIVISSVVERTGRQRREYVDLSFNAISHEDT